MKKRIAFFIGELFMDFQSRLYKGINEYAKENDVLVDIFTNHGIFTSNYLHTRGEIDVITICDPEAYDGILLASDTLTIDGMYEELHERLAKIPNTPVVSIRAELSEYHNVYIDDKPAIKQIVNHLINEHHLKNIFYMSGTQGMVDAQVRLDAYLETMEENGLPVRDTMIFHGNYWTTKAKACLDWFSQDAEEPEAIVCANDFMALSIVSELRERGKKVPEDIAVTGYDNVVEGRMLERRLATSEVPAEELGRKSLGFLCDLIDKKTEEKNVYVSSAPILRGTCGCEGETSKDFEAETYQSYVFLRDTVFSDLALSGNFENCETLDDVLHDAFMFSTNFGYRKMYVCLCKEDSESNLASMSTYTDKMELYAIFSLTEGYVKVNEIFDRSEIIPLKYRDEEKVISVFPLHFRGHCMGYLAIAVSDPSKMKEGFILWSNSLSNYLDKINMYEKNKELLKVRDESYVDVLTGLYNRRGFEANLAKTIDNLEGRSLYVVSIDMDGLKYINDTFGHSAGDYALKTLSIFFKSAQNENVWLARVGGDEFLAMVTGKEEDVEKVCNYIRRKIERFNDMAECEYELSVSMGYEKFEASIGIMNCINKADEKMYAEKSGKKHARK